jgi:NTE family protein
MPHAPAESPRKKSVSAKPKKLRIDLALQGGGSHGAFTWGVLDRLLEEEWLEIAGISGTSAGAMNAVAVAAGLTEGGREGARACLRRFWRRVAETSPFHSWESSPFGALLDGTTPWMQAVMSPWQQAASLVGKQLSPYQLNPLNLNPLRTILAETVDFDSVRACHRTQLFIAATQVSTGDLRVFRQEELTPDMVLASACLPLVFQAVEIEGEAYWDGGYAGNPALLPLISETESDDLLLVQINPNRRDTVPTNARTILDRANEITFNASLLKELRTIALIKEVLEDAGRPDRAYRRPLFRRIDNLRLHKLDPEEALKPFSAGSKTQTNLSFLEQLHSIGRQAAHSWLAENAQHLGQRSTCALPATDIG